jgi:hypothetical protein
MVHPRCQRGRHARDACTTCDCVVDPLVCLYLICDILYLINVFESHLICDIISVAESVDS